MLDQRTYTTDIVGRRHQRECVRNQPLTQRDAALRLGSGEDRVDAFDQPTGLDAQAGCVLPKPLPLGLPLTVEREDEPQHVVHVAYKQACEPMSVTAPRGGLARCQDVREGPVDDGRGDQPLLHLFGVVRERPLPRGEEAARAEWNGVLDDLRQHQPCVVVDPPARIVRR